MQKKFFFIQGAPGVGKSTVINSIRKHLPDGYFIELDQIRAFAGDVDWNKHEKEYFFSLELIANMLRFLTEHGQYKYIFLIDCLSPKGIEHFIKIYGESLNYKQIVFWAEKSILKERLKARKNHVFSNLEISLKMNNYLREVYADKTNNTLFLNTTGLSINEAAKVALDFIRK